MRADALARKQRILTEARRLFAEHGSEISLDSIADASGVGIATLYRNFPSREDLIAAVTLDILSDISEALASAQSQLTSAPRAAWEELVRALVELDLGALTDALGGARWQDMPPETATAQNATLATFTSVLDELVHKEVVRPSLTGLEVIVAIGVLTRPQPKPIRDATPNLVDHLIDAFLSWSSSQASLGVRTSR